MDISLQFTDEIPTFASTVELAMVNRVVSRATEAEYLTWADREGLTSIYHDFLRLAEQVEANPEVPSYDQISAKDSKFIFHDKEGGIILNPYLPFPKLTDAKGRMYVTNDIHAFTREIHVLIDAGSPADLERVLSEPVDNPDVGVYVFPMGETENPFSKDPSQKIQVQNLNCPFQMNRSDNSEREIQGLIRADRWRNVRGWAARTDEQEVGCSRRRCRRETLGILLSNHTITVVLPGEFEALNVLRYGINNRRRNRFNWTRTFPEMAVDRGVVSPSTMFARTEVVSTTSGANRGREFFSVSYPGVIVDANNNRVGSAFEDLVLFDQSFQGSRLSFEGVLGTIDITTGSIRHRWLTGSNNPSSNPISIEFRCQ